MSDDRSHTHAESPAPFDSPAPAARYPAPSRRRVLATSLGLAGAGALSAWAVSPAHADGARTATGATTTGAAAGAAYDELYRPRTHFSPARNWINDPNGLLYHDGTYHLFYQYNPEGAVWGNMSWGHAVSSDLTHWRELDVAIPCDDVEMIFSGSAVFDRDNTSGLGTADDPPLVAVYTSHLRDESGQRQSLAYSTDGGTTWKKYGGNPVLDIGSKNFRDPKVFWHAPTGRWVMVVARSLEYKISLYASPDLRNWSHLSDFGPLGATGGIWECPDLFELPVDGDAGNSRWVMIVNINPGGPAGGSAGQYFLGDFDGTTFTADTTGPPVRWLDHGAEAYAGVTWNDAPDGRRILITWMNNWLYAEKIPTAPWRGAMGFPRQLALTAAPAGAGGAVLVQQPVAELSGLRGATLAQLKGREIKASSTPTLVRDTGLSYEIQADLAPGKAQRCGLDVRVGNGHRTRIGYDAQSKELYVDRTASGADGFSTDFPAVHRAPLTLPADGTLHLHILVDASSVEVYAQGGRVLLTDQIFPGAEDTGLQAFAEGGTARIETLKARKLESVWR